jgi:DhnA family fructose-bisphosphate aldolase class Ia
MANIGTVIRMSRLFDSRTRKIVITPLDDALLAGPEGGLRNTKIKVGQIISGGANAIMGFRGFFERHNEDMKGVCGILNLTASTTRSKHTRKVLVSTVEDAVRLGMDGVGVHVNISSEFETEMLKILGEVSRECERMGMPLMGIMYPRSERDNSDYNYYDWLEHDPEKYAEIVRHAVRVGVELGADFIKTQFTGSVETFQTVIECSSEIPIVIAGGPKVSVVKMLTNAYQAIQAGGAGVSFGRNVFNRDDSSKYIRALRKIVHENATVEEAIQSTNIKADL